MNKDTNFYGSINSAVENAMNSATGKCMLISECEDFIYALLCEGYKICALDNSESPEIVHTHSDDLMVENLKQARRIAALEAEGLPSASGGE